jgi:mannitol operon repressor
MLLDNAEDLAAFASELARESDRGLALVAAALIDEKLAQTLAAFFCETYKAARLLTDANAPLGNFSARIQLCFALGLIDEFEHNEIELLRKVRNEFAHARHGTSFGNARIRGLCGALKSDLPKEVGFPTNDPRFRFTNAAVAIALRIYHRPEWVALHRTVPKEWVSQDSMRWRSVESELPPKDEPVMAVGRTFSPRVMSRKS